MKVRRGSLIASASEERFDLEPTAVEGLMVIRRKPITNGRSFFSRFYCAEAFQHADLKRPMVQINHAIARKKGSLQELHFQHLPHAEWKIVNCLRGEVYDMAVDIRKSSQTYLRWHGEILYLGTLLEKHHSTK